MGDWSLLLYLYSSYTTQTVSMIYVEYLVCLPTVNIRDENVGETIGC